MTDNAAFRIRPTTAGDFAAVDALLARAYPKLLKHDYPPSVLVTALPLISRANPQLLSCGTYYLAETPDGAVLGAGGWTPDRGRAALGHIRHLVTDDRAQRQGIARAIIARALDEARAAGCRHMICWSTRTAEPFYAAMGFASQGPMEVTLAPGIGFPAVRMGRDLQAGRHGRPAGIARKGARNCPLGAPKPTSSPASLRPDHRTGDPT